MIWIKVADGKATVYGEGYTVLEELESPSIQDFENDMQSRCNPLHADALRLYGEGWRSGIDKTRLYRGALSANFDQGFVEAMRLVEREYR